MGSFHPQSSFVLLRRWECVLVKTFAEYLTSAFFIWVGIWRRAAVRIRVIFDFCRLSCGYRKVWRESLLWHICWLCRLLNYRWLSLYLNWLHDWVGLSRCKVVFFIIAMDFSELLEGDWAWNRHQISAVFFFAFLNVTIVFLNEFLLLFHPENCYFSFLIFSQMLMAERVLFHVLGKLLDCVTTEVRLRKFSWRCISRSLLGWLFTRLNLSFGLAWSRLLFCILSIFSHSLLQCFFSSFLIWFHLSESCLDVFIEILAYFVWKLLKFKVHISFIIRYDMVLHHVSDAFIPLIIKFSYIFWYVLLLLTCQELTRILFWQANDCANLRFRLTFENALLFSLSSRLSLLEIMIHRHFAHWRRLKAWIHELIRW